MENRLKVSKTCSQAIVGQHEMVVAWLGVLAPEMEGKRIDGHW